MVKENSTGLMTSAISTPRLGTETRAATNQATRPSKTILHPDMIIEDSATEEEVDANNHSSHKLIEKLQANAGANDAIDDGDMKILRKL